MLILFLVQAVDSSLLWEHALLVPARHVQAVPNEASTVNDVYAALVQAVDSSLLWVAELKVLTAPLQDAERGLAISPSHGGCCQLQ